MYSMSTLQFSNISYYNSLFSGETNQNISFEFSVNMFEEEWRKFTNKINTIWGKIYNVAIGESHFPTLQIEIAILYKKKN